MVIGNNYQLLVVSKKLSRIIFENNSDTFSNNLVTNYSILGIEIEFRVFMQYESDCPLPVKTGTIICGTVPTWLSRGTRLPGVNSVRLDSPVPFSYLVLILYNIITYLVIYYCVEVSSILIKNFVRISSLKKIIPSWNDDNTVNIS